MTEDELLEELYSRYYVPNLDPAVHVTALALAARLGRKEDAAMAILQREVDAGRCEWVDVLRDDNKVVHAVRRVASPPPR